MARGAQGDVLKVLVLSDQHSKSQRYSISNSKTERNQQKFGFFFS